MAFFKCALFLLALCAMSSASPVPEPGFFGPKHEHVVIHVPYKVHTVHHHHVHKVSVPVVKAVPIIKEVPVFKEIHHDHHHSHDYHLGHDYLHSHDYHHGHDYHHHGGWW